MKNLKNLLKTPFQSPISNKTKISFLIIIILGFVDATYITIERFMNKIPPCTLSECGTVLTSSYSEILGIPVSLLGAIYYLVLIILFMIHFDTKKEVYLQFAFHFTIFGLLFSLYFLFVQAFVIKAFCQYCLVSNTTSIILFIISFFIIKKHKKYCDSLNSTNG
jgi:uncharacterized membrane protein